MEALRSQDAQKVDQSGIKKALSNDLQVQKEVTGRGTTLRH